MSSNEASFHARITADAKQFVAEMQGAAAALATLVKQAESAGKVSTGSAKNEGAKAASEIKDVYATARREADKVHEEAMRNIADENAARSKAASGRSSSGDFFQPQAKRTAAIGPVREGSLGAVDLVRLQDVLKTTTQLTEAERKRAEMNKLHNQAIREDQVRFNKIHAQAIKEDHARTAAQRKAITDSAKAQQRQLDSMVTGRYALYDQANGYDLVARKALMLSSALASTVVVAAQFESAFTSVERAMQPLPDEIDGIRSSLLQMSQEMPIAFADMSKIATLGAQMGITASGIEEFTKNVAAFSAVTGSTIDETAQKFGRIAALANIDPSDFNKLGSAVAYTGINAVATEQEILGLTESIAAASTGAGFAADETIAFATTLASLGIAPEQARGVVLRVFADITRAADLGGEKMKAFGDIAGMSANEAAALWKSDPQKFFNSLLTGLGSVENFTAAMDSLGFTETRETNVLQRLAQNMDIYNKSLTDSQKSYEEGAFLADAYAKTADNLQAKFQTLLNTIQSLADSLGSGLIGPMGVLIDSFKEVAQAAQSFFKTPFGQVLTPLVVGMGVSVAALTAFKAVSLKATAQLFAMRTAMIQMGRAGELANGGFRNSISTMLGLQRAVEMTDGKIHFMTRSQYELAKANGAVAVTTKGGAAALNGWASQSKAAAVGTRLFSAALSTMGVVTAVAGIASIIGTFAELNRVTVDLAGSGGGLASFRDAMYEDTKAVKEGAEYYGYYQSKVTESKTVAQGYISTLEAVTGGQAQLNSKISEVNDTVQSQTLYLGQNSQAWLANALANDPAVQEMFKKMQESGKGAQETLKGLGINFIELEKAALRKPGSGALEYIKRVSPEVKASMDSLVRGASAVSDGTTEGMKPFIETIAKSGNGATATAAKMWLLATAVDGVTSAGVENSKLMELLGIQFPDLTEEADDLTESLGGVAKAVRTVVDYASDLSGVFSRVTEIKMGRRQELDAIASGWFAIKDKAAGAAKAIEDATNAQKELTADKAVLQYQLSVAERYGDDKRAAVIRAKLVKIDSKIADETDNIKEAQDDANMSTKGGTKNAIENRAALLGMVGSYQGLIEMYAKTGLKGQALEDKITELSGKFEENALAAGYAKEDIQPYVNLFSEFKTVADDTPREVTVEFRSNVTAATQAVNEYVAKLNASKGTYTSTLHTKLVTTTDAKSIKTSELLAEAKNWERIRDMAMITINDRNATPWAKAAANTSARDASTALFKIYPQLRALSPVPGRKDGGYIAGPGTGTSDSIPMMLSNGEFVMKASAVSAYGVDFMNAINQQRAPRSMPKSASVTASANSQVVYLSPDDRQLLRAAIDRPINLYTDNQRIAASANAGNVILAQRGSN